ncbi:MAG: hypothetical protein ACWGNV_09970 [Bacteroidales bacterium]
MVITFIMFPLKAQKKGYDEGYIIHMNGDTVQGWVKDRSAGTFTELYSKIRFKSQQSRLRKKYSPDDLLGYGYDGLAFESVPLREESEFFRFRYILDERNHRVFLQVISSNEPLTWYHWEYIDDESNYVDFIPLFHKSYSPEMVRVTQGILGLKRNRLMEYFQDCPELVWAIDNKEVNLPEEVYNFYLSHCLDQKLEGKWLMNKVIQDGNDVTPEHNPDKERYIIFYDDGSFETGGKPYGPNTGRYTYSPEQGLLYLYSDAGPEDDSQWKVSLEKDTMTWQGLGSEWANQFLIIHLRSAR